MTFNIILYHNFSPKNFLEKIFQSRGIMPILEGPKFIFYLKVFIKYENLKDSYMTSHLMSPREIYDVKMFIYFEKYVKNGLDNIPARF